MTSEIVQHDALLGDLKLNDFAVIADFNVMWVGREEPAEFQCKATTRAWEARSSHSNDCKAEMQISDANVCKSTIPAKEHDCDAGHGKRTDF